jgi:ferredoxin-thioredoxin reductase catalytic subunit
MDVSKEEINKLRKEYEKFAEEHGLKLNPNEQIVEAILRALIMNEKQFGKKYCPCRIEKTDDTVCPCKYLFEDIEKYGHCHCNLFVKKDLSR